MNLLRARRGGWLWPAVLVASAVLVLSSGWQVARTSVVAADVPVTTQLEPAAPSTWAEAPPAPRLPSTGTPGWRTRSAAPREPAAVVPPERLVARSVGLDLRVVPTGVRRDGQMDLPDNPAQVGWYRFGATPTDHRGAVVLAGHVDSDRYGAGPLTRVVGLERGDRIELHAANGKTSTYVVTRLQRIKKSDFSPKDVFALTGPSVLRLITCGGAYDPGRGGYQDNLVVTAEPR